MSIHSLSANEVTDPVTQTRIDLAAALRLAVLHELEEGLSLIHISEPTRPY